MRLFAALPPHTPSGPRPPADRRCAGRAPDTGRSLADRSARPVTLGGVDPKTRNRIMAGALVLLFVAVAVASAFGR